MVSSIKRLGVALFPLDELYPEHLIYRYPFMQLDKVRQCKGRVSCLRGQHYVQYRLILNLCRLVNEFYIEHVIIQFEDTPA